MKSGLDLQFAQCKPDAKWMGSRDVKHIAALLKKGLAHTQQHKTHRWKQKMANV